MFCRKIEEMCEPTYEAHQETLFTTVVVNYLFKVLITQTSLANSAALPRNQWHLNPCDYIIITSNATKILWTSIVQVPTAVFQSLKYTNPVRSIRKLMVHFSGRTWWPLCICCTLRATAVSSCGRCASLCAWWLGQWSWSGRPELHPVVPALSLPPGQGSSAASASANTHTIQCLHTLIFKKVITRQPPVNNWGARHK